MRRRTLAALLTAAALSLAGCSTGSTDTPDAPPKAVSDVDAGAFPVTIEHAYGETTIEQEPKRIATLGWSDQDVVLSLGVVPVGAIQVSWGGNDEMSTPGSTRSSPTSEASSRLATATRTGPRSRRSPSSRRT